MRTRILLALLALLLLTLPGPDAQVPTPGNRIAVSKQSYLQVETFILEGQGGPGHVLRQNALSAPVVSGPLSTSDLTDGALLSHLTGPQTLIDTRIKPRQYDASDTGTVAFSYDTYNSVSLATVTTTTAFSNPTGTPYDGDALVIRACSTTSQPVSWGSQFEGTYGQALPSATSGAGRCDLWGWKWRAATSKWGLVATTQLGSKTGSVQLNPNSVKYPASNPGTLSNAETTAHVAFDNSVSQCVFWQFDTPLDYLSTPAFQFEFGMHFVTSGGLGMTVALMVPTDAEDYTDDANYDTANVCPQTTVAGTAHRKKTVTCPLTANDSVGAGKFTKLRLCRNATIGSDAEGIAEVIGGLFTYVRP